MQFVIVCDKYLLTGIVREFCENLLHGHKIFVNFYVTSVLGGSLTELFVWFFFVLFFFLVPDFLNQYLTMLSIALPDVLILFC